MHAWGTRPRRAQDELAPLERRNGTIAEPAQEQEAAPATVLKPALRVSHSSGSVRARTPPTRLSLGAWPQRTLAHRQRSSADCSQNSRNLADGLRAAGRCLESLLASESGVWCLVVTGSIEGGMA